jgi:glutamate 5-kinase
MTAQRGLARRKCWVVKIGSALLTDVAAGLDRAAVADWVAQAAELRRRGIDVVLVSSGAVAEGMKRLGWQRRPHALFKLQAAAAVGQMGLVQIYESAFQRHGLQTAQVLLTNDDLSDRTRYLNARSTLIALIDLGVVPVINENDSVVTDEIRFGDNDTLAALVTNLVEAELLVILTDVGGLYDRDPRAGGEARLVAEGRAGDPALAAMAGASGALGRGGMVTKLSAAEKAARSGAATVITSGREPGVLTRLADGDRLGTRLVPSTSKLQARKRWLAGHLQPRGRLMLDEGAARVLRESGRSLLPVGVTRVEGRFERGDMVACLDPSGERVANGLVNYSADEAARIAGHPSDAIESILGYVDEPELIHRDNMVVL